MTLSTTRPARRRLGVAVALVATLSAAACGGGSDPLAEGGQEADPAATGDATSIIVGSADFTESQLLARIYTGALQADGVEVSEPRLGIGAREAYLQGMTDGSINVIPEYSGALAAYYDQDYAGTEPNEVYQHLQEVLPDGLAVLEPSQAENKDTITVTRETAEENSLRTMEDLQAAAGNMTLGAPPEFKTRRQGIPGMQSEYGIEFGQVRELGGQALLQALVNGQVDAANIFSTDPAYTQHDLVPLEDGQGLFGAQNVLPLVTDEVAQNEQVAGTLNAVSEALTTEDLQQMLTQIDVERADPQQVADEFLQAKGLD